MLYKYRTPTLSCYESPQLIHYFTLRTPDPIPNNYIVNVFIQLDKIIQISPFFQTSIHVYKIDFYCAVPGEWV